MKKTLLCLLVMLCSIFTFRYSAVRAADVTVTSPDGTLILTLKTDEGLSYSLTSHGTQLIAPSPMGFELKGERPMTGDFTLVRPADVRLCSDHWRPVVRNRHAEVSLSWNEATLQLVERQGDRRRMDIEVRVFDGGAAFRYTLYGAPRIGDRQITRELTGFNVPESASAWAAIYNPDYTSSQENSFWKTAATELSTERVMGLPFLVELDTEHYVAITEACIDDFTSCYIGRSEGVHDGLVSLSTRLSPLPGEPVDGVKVRFDEQTTSPWRVILVADHPGRFIESEIIQGLNPPCAIADPSWIKPGLSAWDHWWSGEVKMETDVIKQYIDLAAAEGWPYMLIDWQWYGPYNTPQADITRPAPQLDMPGILAYARQKNVRCWLWLYCTDVNRNGAFRRAFAEYEKWGIAGIKIDFMDRDDQEMMRWYRRIVRCAAEHHLMVDFHGATKPDGIERTWPNLLTREGVLGEEYYKFSTRVTPEHNTTLPFTRMLAGPMDYTPGGFLNVTPADFRQQTPTLVTNTRCAELAKFVIYESPLTVFSEHPDHVLGQPGADFLSRVQTTWDDTRFLAGYPGEYVALAHRNGSQWFIGVLGNSQPRTLTLDTSFLPAGDYELEYWADGAKAGKKPTEVAHKVVTLRAGRPLKIRLAPAGGYVAILNPKSASK